MGEVEGGRGRGIDPSEAWVVAWGAGVAEASGHVDETLGAVQATSA